MNDANALLERLRDYLLSEDSCTRPIQTLHRMAVIEVSIAGCASLHLRPGSEHPEVSFGSSSAADFVFTATPEAIEILIAEKGLSSGQLAVRLIREILNQQVQVAMPTSLFMIPRKGYLNLIKFGGKELLSELQKHNLSSVSQILAALKKLKR